jgi:hypothetical protein
MPCSSERGPKCYKNLSVGHEILKGQKTLIMSESSLLKNAWAVGYYRGLILCDKYSLAFLADSSPRVWAVKFPVRYELKLQA